MRTEDAGENDELADAAEQPNIAEVHAGAAPIYFVSVFYKR